jgi:tight adherence protein C
MEMPSHIVAAAAAIAVSIPVLFWGLAGLGRKERRPLEAAGRPGERGPTDQRQIRLQESPIDRAFRPFLAWVVRRARRLTPAGWVGSLEHRWRLAGSSRTWTVERILTAKAFLGFGGLLVSFLFLNGFALSFRDLTLSVGRLLLAVVIGALLYFLPDLLLWSAARERQTVIQRELPDTLDQMTISVEAGLGFEAVLQRVGATGEGPLGQELRRTLQEMAIGVPRRQAFQHLLERTDVQELRHFVYSIRQAEQYGLPVSQVLRVQAAELRVSRRHRAEERAQKMPVKIVFPLVVCIFPSLFIVILGPAVLRIWETLF